MNSLSAALAFRLSAALGFLGVALGAFGAHALQATLTAHGSVATWGTAVLYHLVHAVVLLGLATLRPWPRTAWLFLALGVFGFSGSLYVYALTKVRWLAFITPFGGLCFLIGWFLLALRRSEDTPAA